MTFKDNINRLCKLHGTNLTTLIKECGFSSSKATAINKGQIPTEEQLLILAKALNCSVMDFFADEVDFIAQDDDEQILIEGYRSLPKSQQLRLLAYYYALTEGRE
jgi:hypothetical protein